jgi:methionyl-tRNA formyltransferase
VLDAAAPGLPEHPRLAAAALARRRADPPRHRGRRRQTGITIMQMDAGLDTGDMLLASAADHPDDTTATLHDRLAALGAQLIVQALAGLALRPAAAGQQPAEGVTYAHKIDKAEAAIDWRQSAATLASAGCVPSTRFPAPAAPRPITRP